MEPLEILPWDQKEWDRTLPDDHPLKGKSPDGNGVWSQELSEAWARYDAEILRTCQPMTDDEVRAEGLPTHEEMLQTFAPANPR